MKEPPSPPEGERSQRTRPRILRGIAGSPGIAVGPCVVVGSVSTPVVRRTLAEDEIEAETARFREAVTRAQASIHKVADRMKASGAGAAEAAILEAYVAMIGDELVEKSVLRRIRDERQNVEWAVAQTIAEIRDKLAGSNDPYLVERHHDIAFVGERLLRALAGAEDVIALPTLSRPSVIIAPDLSPADTAAMTKEPVLAIVTESGTRTSHTSIMARALEIPAVVGVADVLASVSPGETVIVDGLKGEVVVGPTPEMLVQAERRRLRHEAFVEHLREDRERQATLADGTVVHLRANIELPAEVHIALDHGAEGIGLFRSELLYIERTTPPSEEEQFAIYKAIAEVCAPRPVVLRTFDIGGDKLASIFPAPKEANPALGRRAIRLALAHPELFLDQLRAMVRASAHGDVRILLPMISTLGELREARRLLQQAIEEVDLRGQPRAANIPLGMMIEVPSAAILASAFAQEADFLSIGTNDLVQYTLAIDRGSRALASMASHFEPALLYLLGHVARAAREHEKPLAVCGAMASEPLAALLLVGLGVRELSMEAAALPEIKEALSRMTVAELEAMASVALTKTTAQEVESFVRSVLEPRLGDLLSGEATNA